MANCGTCGGRGIYRDSDDALKFCEPCRAEARKYSGFGSRGGDVLTLEDDTRWQLKGTASERVETYAGILYQAEIRRARAGRHAR